MNVSRGSIGITLYYSNHNNVSYCNDSLNKVYGLISYNSNNNTIIKNRFNNNAQHGLYLINCYNNNISNNQGNDNEKYAIYLKNDCNNNTIFNNTVNDNGINGINLLSNCDNNTISNNTVNNNGHAGIYLDNNCNNNTLLNNVAYYNTIFGIYFSDSRYSNISGNLMKECGIWYEGSLDELTSHFIDTTNLVNGRPVYYYVNVTNLGTQNFTWAGSAGQILLVNCNISYIYNYNISHGSVGISLHYCNDGYVLSNNASYNKVYGIYLANSNNFTISNNNVSYTRHYGQYKSLDQCGIYLEYSINNSISRNFANNNARNGITLNNDCSENYLSSNAINDNDDNGIYMNNCDDNIILNNTVIGNNANGILMSDECDNNIILNNTINGNNVNGISMDNCHNNDILNNTIGNNDDGIYMNNCNYNDILNNTIGNNDDGISMNYCNYNDIFNNTINDSNDDGIYMINCHYNDIINNTINDNNDDGIYINGCDNNIIFGNKILENQDHGILLDNSNYNNITLNIINNSVYGIEIQKSSYNRISGNNISFNSNDGIYVNQFSDYNIISSNIVLNNTGSGIHLYDQCDNNQILENIACLNDEHGIFLEDHEVDSGYNEDLNNNYEWIDISSEPDLGLNDDEYIGVLLPFDFEFYDSTFSTVYISDNGYLSFADSSPDDYTNEDIPLGGADYEYLIAPFWDDLYSEIAGGSGTIHVKDFGTYWVVQWVNMSHFDYNHIGTFQVILFQSGDIVFNFKNINYTAGGYTTGINYGVNPSIGDSFNNIEENNVTYSILYSRIEVSYGNNVSKNIATKNKMHGIYFKTIRNSYILENNATNNINCGIYIKDCHYIQIFENNISSNRNFGLVLEENINNSISGNLFQENLLSGFYCNASNNNSITNNFAHNNTIHGFYIVNSNNNELVENNATFNGLNGIVLENCNNTDIIGNKGNLNDQFGFYFENCYNNVVNRNFAINNSVTGIVLDNCELFIIYENNASLNQNFGIWLKNSPNNNLTTNIINNNTHGLVLETSNYNNISNNFAYFNDISGLFLNSSDYNYIIGNNFSCNVQNGIYSLSSDNNDILGNNVSLNHVYGIWLKNSNDSLISENYFQYNGYSGIFIDPSNNDIISANTIINNGQYGIILESSTYIQIIENTINNNGQYGITLESSTNIQILENTINFNGIGVFLIDSSHNTISDNNVSHNNICGFNLTSSIDNDIIGNNISFNIQHGIFLNYSDSNTIVGNNTIYSNGRNGIYFIFSNNNEIFNNTIYFNDEHGIFMFESNLNIVSNNTINENDELNYAGICIKTSNSTIIKYNNIYNNYFGIFLEDGSITNSITRNNIKGNHHGIYLKINCINNTLYGNNASLNSVYGILLETSNNNSIVENIGYSNDCGIYLLTSNYNNITNNYFDYNNICGINLTASVYNNITGNSATFNDEGICLISGADNNFISGNTIQNTTSIGIHIYNSDSNTITENFIKKNLIFGARVEQVSSQNLFYCNNFSSNGWHALDSGNNNYWNNSVIGNYWDNYTGKDANDDGIGDTGYRVNYTNGYDYKPKWWDAPVISLVDPTQYDLFGVFAPNFTLLILEGVPDTQWYTLEYLSVISTKYFFINNRSIDPDGWINCGNGTITLEFIVNDSRGWTSDPVSIIIRKDIIAPSIYCISPYENQLVGVKVIDFFVRINDSNLDTMWYSLNRDVNTTFTVNGTFDLTQWSHLPNGTITIAFYANDTVSNNASLIFNIRIDIFIPRIIINLPNNNTLWDVAPPINLTVYGSRVDKIWYTITGNSSRNFLGNNSQVLLNQSMWNNLIEGWFHIYFFANNSVNNINDTLVLFLSKDTLGPIITILYPYQRESLRRDPSPDYTITIAEPNLNTTWYIIASGSDKHIISSNTGRFSTGSWRAIWDSLSDGDLIVITFYANDSLGHVGSASVTVVKWTPSASKPAVTEDDSEVILVEENWLPLVFMGIFGISVFTAALVSKKKLTEEELVVVEKMSKGKLKLSAITKETYFLVLDTHNKKRTNIKLFLFAFFQVMLGIILFLVLSWLNYVNEISILSIILIEMLLSIYLLHLINKIYMKEKKLSFKKKSYSYNIIGLYLGTSLLYILLFLLYFGIYESILSSQIIICSIVIVGQFFVVFINRSINYIRASSWILMMLFATLYLIEEELNFSHILLGLLVLGPMLEFLYLSKSLDFSRYYNMKPILSSPNSLYGVMRPYYKYIWLTISILSSVTLYFITTLYYDWIWYRALLMSLALFFLLTAFILLEKPKGLGWAKNLKIVIFTLIWCALIILSFYVRTVYNYTILIPVLIVEIFLLIIFGAKVLLSNWRKKIKEKLSIKKKFFVIGISIFLLTIIALIGWSLIIGKSILSIPFTLLMPILIVEFLSLIVAGAEILLPILRQKKKEKIPNKDKIYLFITSVSLLALLGLIGWLTFLEPVSNPIVLTMLIPILVIELISIILAGKTILKLINRKEKRKEFLIDGSYFILLAWLLLFTIIGIIGWIILFGLSSSSLIITILISILMIEIMSILIVGIRRYNFKKYPKKTDRHRIKKYVAIFLTVVIILAIIGIWMGILLRLIILKI